MYTCNGTSATSLTVAQAAPAQTPNQQKIDQLKGAELSGVERVGLRDDTDILPW